MNFRFIDLFAGIGGMRLPFDALGGTCVLSSELDPAARSVYLDNFPQVHEINTDVSEYNSTPDSVPNHDLLLAGFPCQPFSSAGKRLGFDDTRGTLFFSIANIARAKRPRVLILENVRGLKSHDGGKTLETIRNVLTDIGYVVYEQVLNARDYGLPQNRNRLFLVCILADLPGASSFSFPQPTHVRAELRVESILEEVGQESDLTISARLWQGHRDRRDRNRSLGKGFGYQLVSGDSEYTATLSARYYKDGAEILVGQQGDLPRLLSVREAANLQGFPKDFKLHPSKKHAYKQLGNAVPVSVVTALAGSVYPFLNSDL